MNLHNVSLRERALIMSVSDLSFPCLAPCSHHGTVERILSAAQLMLSEEIPRARKVGFKAPARDFKNNGLSVLVTFFHNRSYKFT